jgi:hypothetical protein
MKHMVVHDVGPPIYLLFAYDGLIRWDLDHNDFTHDVNPFQDVCGIVFTLIIYIYIKKKNGAQCAPFILFSLC